MPDLTPLFVLALLGLVALVIAVALLPVGGMLLLGAPSWAICLGWAWCGLAVLAVLSVLWRSVRF